jgi:hypothetical protein
VIYDLDEPYMSSAMLQIFYKCNPRGFVSGISIILVTPTCKEIKGRKPSINYNQSHVITYNEYTNTF